MATPVYPALVTLRSSGPNANPVGAGYKSSVSITRPSNTTAYTAGDVIGIADAGTPANAGSAIHTLANVGPSGAHLLITEVRLEIDVAAVPSGMTTFRLHLYDTSPTAILDNAAWDLPAGDRAKYLGYIDLAAPVDLVSTLWSENKRVDKHIKLADGSTSLYVELETVGGYTPSSGAVKAITVLALSLA